RSARVAADAANSRRGLAMGRNAVADVVLNTDALRRQRQNERRAFATSVDQTGFGQRQSGADLALSGAGTLGGLELGRGQLGLGYDQLQLGYDELGERGRQFDRSLALQRLGMDRGYALDATRAITGASVNPY